VSFGTQRYTTQHIGNFQRHQESCLSNSEQTVLSVQKPYGNLSTPLEKLIDAGYLPADSREFRKTCFSQGFILTKFHIFI
jgi:hypothetical protein